MLVIQSNSNLSSDLDDDNNNDLCLMSCKDFTKEIETPIEVIVKC